MKGECLAGCKGQRESIFVNLMTGAFSFAVFPVHQAGEPARPFFNLIVLVTFLQPFNCCDYDDFRYFGLELLNLLLTNSEGLSHCYLIIITSSLLYSMWTYFTLILPVRDKIYA